MVLEASDSRNDHLPRVGVSQQRILQERAAGYASPVVGRALVRVPPGSRSAICCRRAQIGLHGNPGGWMHRMRLIGCAVGFHREQ